MIPMPPPPLVLLQSSMLLALVLALARFRPVNKSARAVPRRMGQHHRTETLMHTYMQSCSTPPLDIMYDLAAPSIAQLHQAFLHSGLTHLLVFAISSSKDWDHDEGGGVFTG